MAAGWFGVLYRNAAGLLAALIVLAPAAARGQDSSATEDRVADTLAKAHQALTAIPPRPSCAGGDPDEIVVCAPTDSDRYRVPHDSNSTDIGIPRYVVTAPSHMPGMVGAGVTIKGCFLQKCPTPQYYLDVASLPEAPPGSDADKIAKGELAAP